LSGVEGEAFGDDGMALEVAIAPRSAIHGASLDMLTVAGSPLRRKCIK
jgi:hypothetical protein